MKITQKFTVLNPAGLNARACIHLHQLVEPFESRLTIKKESKAKGLAKLFISADLKDISNLLAIVCPLGEKIEITAQGKDAKVAMAHIRDFYVFKPGEKRSEEPTE